MGAMVHEAEVDAPLERVWRDPGPFLEGDGGRPSTDQGGRGGRRGQKGEPTGTGGALEQ